MTTTHPILYQLASEARSFLEPLWLAAHRGWTEEPPPNPPSKYMCRYSSIFLREILIDASFFEVVIRLGRPASKELNGTVQGQFGYCDNDGRWHDHSWILLGDVIIDITADQFGGTPITIVEGRSSTYRANLCETDVQEDLLKLRRRAEEWLALWRNRRKHPGHARSTG